MLELTQSQVAWQLWRLCRHQLGAKAERVRHCLRPLSPGRYNSGCQSSTSQQVQPYAVTQPSQSMT